MYVRELVTMLEEVNPDYSRQALLDNINYVMREVFASRLSFSKVVDPATGLDPLIIPSSITHTIPGVSSIGRVYKNKYDFTDYNVVGNTIYFVEDQLGSSYYVEQYKSMDVTSENNLVPIPDELIHYLEDGVNARIQVKQHGQQQPIQEWRKYVMPELRRRLNANYKWGGSNGTQTTKSYQ